jgi:DNA-binding NtrC family response regulator
MPPPDKHPILIVDDEVEILHSLKALLRKEFEVHAAASAAEALDLLARQPVHVVMADQRMPGISGVDFLARVRQAHPEAVRLIFTGYADIKAVIDAINQGHVYRYLTKPWDPDELRSVLRQACAEHDQAHEAKALLADVRAWLGRCLPALQGPLAEVARALEGRLQKALGQ